MRDSGDHASVEVLICGTCAAGMVPGAARKGGVGNRRPVHYGFVVVPGYQMASVALAVDALSTANRVLECRRFEWDVMSVDGGKVEASSGLTLARGGAMAPVSKHDALFFCAGHNVEEAWSRALDRLIRISAAAGLGIGGICTGSWLLARAKVLEGFRCTVHWEYLSSLRNQFPELNLTNNLFEIDGDRYTCAGGEASLNMMICLISQHCGHETAQDVAERFCMQQVGGLSDQQRLRVRQYAPGAPEYLSATVQLMHNNIEEPLRVTELAELMGVSVRQLERAFTQYLQCAPQRYYLNLRLRQGQHMLRYSGLRIGEIAYACGFKSIQHFSRCYKQLYGTSPKHARLEEA